MHLTTRLPPSASRLLLASGLAFAMPALAACPPDLFADQLDFSHVDSDPAADGPGDKGGFAVATSGEVVAYGMVGTTGSSKHHVYLYQRGATPAQWSYLKRLAEPGAARSIDHFGEVLAMDGDTLIAGARNAQQAGGNSAGAVHVFKRDHGGANAWGVAQSIYADYAQGFRDFGESLDIHRNRIVAGDTSAGDGRAVILERASANAGFFAVATLLPPAIDLANSVSYATRVTLYGDIAVVSDPDYKAPTDSFARGRVYVYARDQGGPGQWGLVTTLASPAGIKRFGSAISIWGSDDQTRGETIAVANSEQDGHVFLFGRDTGGANLWGQIVDLEPDDMGAGGAVISSVHLHSNELLVGAPEANGVENVTGAVYVYHQQTGGNHNWGQAQKFYSQSNNFKSNYGYALDWSAGVAVIGDPLADYGTDAQVGHAYILFDDVIFCDPFE